MNEVRAVGATTPFKAAQRALYEYLALYSSLLLLAGICLSWSLLALPLYLLLPRRPAIVFGRYGIMAAFRLYSHWLTAIGAFKLDLSAVDSLRGEGPLILAPNHPCLIDALLILTRHPYLACVMKSDLMGNILLGPGARLARYIRNGSSLQMVRESVADLKDGGTLLLFPEGTRSARAPIGTLKRSIGLIARRAQVPVQTLIIEANSPFLGKGRGLWSRPSLPVTYRVRLGRRFEPPQDVALFMTELDRHYRNELAGGQTAQWLGRSKCQ